MAHQRGAPVGLAGEGAGVGVDQELVLVEAVPFLRRPGAVGAQGVEGAGGEAGHVAVEDVVGGVSELQARQLALRRGGVEEADPHLGGGLGVDGEVDALAVGVRPQGVGDAGPHLELLLAHRCAPSRGGCREGAS